MKIENKVKKTTLLLTLALLFNFFDHIAYAEQKIDTITNNKNLEISNSIQNLYKSGFLYLKNKDFEQAIKDFTKAIDLDTKNIESYNNRGKSYYEFAIYRIEQNNKALFEDTEFKRTLGYLSLADKDFEEITKIDDKNLEAYNNRGMVYLKLSNLIENALSSRLKELNLFNKLNKKITNNDLEITDDKLTELNKHIKQMQDSSSQLLKEGEVFLKKAMSISPDNPQTYNNLAYYCISKEDYESAENNIKKAIEISPQNAKFYNTLGLVYLVNNKYDLAEKTFKQGIETDNKDSEIYRNLSLVYWKQGDYNLSYEIYDNLLKKEPFDKVVESMYSNFLFDYLDKYPDEANVLIEKSIKKNVENKAFKIVLSNTYKSIGVKLFFEKNTKEAIKYFEKSRELNPNNKLDSFIILSFAQLAKSYKDSSNYKEAIEIYKNILKMDPNDKLAYSVSLASAYKKNKDFNSAIKIYEQRIKKYPNFAPTFYELSSLYALSNRSYEAIKFLKIAIKLDKNNKDKVKKDIDFKNIRNEKEYRRLIK